MQQIFLNLASGEISAEQAPSPVGKPGHLLIATTHSMISPGTERMLGEFGQASLLGKARQQPDKVRQVLDKIKTDGLWPTIEAVRSKMAARLPLGYCNVGRVLEVGAGVRGFKVGDRVASNGPHAEVVCVPQHLCCRLPEEVSDERAAFTVLGSIGLQGLRLARPTLGECFVVLGLGVIGQLTASLLLGNGCRVLGLDLDQTKLAAAAARGVEVCPAGDEAAVLQRASAFSRGRGVDGVIIAASTKDDGPMRQATAMCRQRGRVVLVGVVGLKLSRDQFYQKELSFQVSCSYGPGRYDPAYEEGGQDYPAGLVRWTEQRNFEAVVDMMASGALAPEDLISHRLPLAQAGEAYRLLKQDQSSLGILLTYEAAKDDTDKGGDAVISLGDPRSAPAGQANGVAVIGAGNYAVRTLLPALAASGARLRAVAARGGAEEAEAAKRFGFEQAVSDVDTVLQDPEVGLVFIATRHDSHADLAVRCLQAGKQVFVEKPLALNQEQLSLVQEAVARAGEAGPAPLITVGFNRRFAPLVGRMAELLAPLGQPKAMIMTVNAGALPADHWTLDPDVGGGRLIGEACHHIDLLRFLAGAPATGLRAFALRPPDMTAPSPESFTLSLTFADGSLGAVHYLANGHPTFAKERLEVFCGGGILRLDNFRTLEGWGFKGLKRRKRLVKQDKGHQAMIQAFLDAAGGRASAPIAWEELLEVTRLSLQGAEQLAAAS